MTTGHVTTGRVTAGRVTTGAPPPRPWRRISLSARLVLLGVAGLAAGLGVGGVALVSALGYAIERTIDTEALQTARDIARLVDEQALPDPAPVAGGQIVQVVDAQHRVRSASINADRLVPILRTSELATARGGQRLIVEGERIGSTGPLRVVALPAGPPGDRQTVIVARPLADARQSVAVLRTWLLWVYPLVLLTLGLLGWRVVAAALRPVEALRAGAARITGAASEERLPVPPSRDEIHRLAETLNDMLDRLAAARARQRAFVADAAHELRSPLASMRTQLEVAQRVGPEPTLTSDLLADVERLSRLVNDLLLLARADDARSSARTGPVELTTLAREVVARYDTARVPVRVVAADDPLWIVGDADELGRVVTNLVDNAVRHASGHVVVGVSAAGPYHLVTVTDDGPGISVEDRQRVFDRFTRLDDARASDAGGAGLGLAIVRELVRRHGGTVVLTDASPGVRAEVRLPCGRP